MKNKGLVALVSIVAAFLLWTYVVTVENPEYSAEFYNIPVVFEGESILEERGLMVVGGTEQTVTMKLKGNRSDLYSLKSSDITIKADLSKVDEPGIQRIQYNHYLPGNIASNAIIVESKAPSMLEMTFARRETKNVDVKVVLNGSVPTDYIADQDTLVLDRQTVKITGPEEQVNQITQAVIKVELTDRTESFSESYRYTLCNEGGEPVDASLVSVEATEVNVTMSIQRVKEIPLVLTVISGGGATQETSKIVIEPKTIKVSGSDKVLENLNELNIGTVNLGELWEGTNLVFPITVPDNVTNRSAVNEASVSIKFPKLLRKIFTIPGDNIQCVNVPEGLEAEIVTQSLKLELRGALDLVSPMSASNFTLRVDFAGKQAGTFTMQVEVVMDAGYESVGVMGNCSVTAILREPEVTEE